MKTDHSHSPAQTSASQRQPSGRHRRLCAQILLAAAAASVSLGAQACGKWDFGCHIKKVVSDISDAVTQTVKSAGNASTVVVYTLADAQNTLVAFGYTASALGQSGLQQAVGLLNTLAHLQKAAVQDTANVTAALNSKLAMQLQCKGMRHVDPQCYPGWQADFDKQIAALQAKAVQSATALAAAEQALALQVSAVAQQEFDQAGATITASEKAALHKATKVVHALKTIETTGVDFIESGYTAYLAKLQAVAVRSLAKKYLSDNTVFLQGMAKVQALDADGQAALNRIQRALPVAFAQAGAVTPQTQRDMLQVAVKLGLVSADGITPPTLTPPSSKSSFTIFVSGNAAWVAGVAATSGFTMNLYPEADGSYLVAAVETVGGSVGWQIGANAQFGIAWSPDPVLKSIGPSLGVGIDAGVPTLSGAVTVAWDPTRLTSAWDIRTLSWNGSPVPTVSLAIGAGPSLTPVSAAIQGGYTFLVAKQ